MANEIRDRLREPFHPNELEWRVDRGWGQGASARAEVVPYVTNRAIMDRLDEVCGLDGWQNAFTPLAGGGFLCGIGIATSRSARADEEIHTNWAWRWDGADSTNFEAVKGGISSAMKRAAVQWGVGRYLYGLGKFEIAANHSVGKDGKDRYYIPDGWTRPELPAWALPKGIDGATGEIHDGPTVEMVTPETELVDTARVFDNFSDRLKNAPNPSTVNAIGAEIKVAVGRGDLTGPDMMELREMAVQRQRELKQRTAATAG